MSERPYEIAITPPACRAIAEELPEAVAVAASPAAAKTFLAKSKADTGSTGVFIEESTPTTFIVTIDLLNDGQYYLGSGQQVSGKLIASGGCGGYKASRQKVVQCIRSMMAAQARKAASLG